jgi:choline-glycine betaine transporter
MARSAAIELLTIRTIRSGFYQGFNPVVAMTAKFVVACLALAIVLAPNSGQMLAAITDATLGAFAGWYNGLLALVLVVVVGIALLPVSGRVRLGRDDEAPAIGRLGWLSMMFCSGIGTGILVFSVSEPISHFIENPKIIGGSVAAGSEAAIPVAMGYVFLHWGFTAWACYAIVGLSLGLACFRFGQPLTMRSALVPLFGRRLAGWPGHLIDIVSILAIIFGTTTTIVLGLEQVCTGFARVFGTSPSPVAGAADSAPLTALLTALVVAIASAIAAITSGIERGVKWTSQTGILLAFAILVVFAIFGAGSRAIPVLLGGLGEYLSALPGQILSLEDPALSSVAHQQRDWQEAWTIFYWAWWIAFAPFVGLFLARVSRGRTVREFILGAVLCPAIVCFVWFATIGGSALLAETDGTSGGRLVETAHAFRIYEAVDLLMPASVAEIITVLLVFLFLVLVVASSTAAILGIKSIGAGGSVLGETKLHSSLWAIVIATLTGSVVAAGGTTAIRGAMMVGALPFSAIIALMIPSALRMLLAADASPAGRN